jgi:hypothetical protein
MVKIIKLSAQYVIIYKPAGVPSQPDPSGDADALSLSADLLRKSGEDGALWLVHRLDRTVGGLLVFALYPALPNQPPVSELQDFVQTMFMGPFTKLGKIFNLNRAFDMRLINITTLFCYFA